MTTQVDMLDSNFDAYTEHYEDYHIACLAHFYAHHPVWNKATNQLRPGAASTVYFSHKPDTAWCLIKTEEGVRLYPGPAEDPDFGFRFPPEAIEELVRVDGGVDDIAVALFDLMLSDDPARHVAFVVLAPFWRIARNGHLQMMLTAGPRVIAYGAGHGIRSVGQLRVLAKGLRGSSAEDVAPPAQAG